MKPFRLLVAGSAVVTVLTTGALYFLGRAGGGPSAVAQFSVQGVTVSVTVKDHSPTHATLVATFTPQHPGFHLYSVDLPADGIKGVGRPTKLAVQGALKSAGPLAADAQVVTIRLAGTTLDLPVYPPGPVTVDLPVTVGDRGKATVLVGYAACSPTACMPPVTDRPIDVQVTDSGIVG